MYANSGQEIRVFGRRRQRNCSAAGGRRDQSVPSFARGVLWAAAVETDTDPCIQELRCQRKRTIRASTNSETKTLTIEYKRI